MAVRMKTPHTEPQCVLTVMGPSAAAAAALRALQHLGFVALDPPAATVADPDGRGQGSDGEPDIFDALFRAGLQGDDASTGHPHPWELPPEYQGWHTGLEGAESVPWREAFPPIPESEEPGRMLRAARTREALSQTKLATLTGIPQRHLSEMEHGKRPIGKALAKKLAKVLQIDYRILL